MLTHSQDGSPHYIINHNLNTFSFKTGKYVTEQLADRFTYDHDEQLANLTHIMHTHVPHACS